MEGYPWLLRKFEASLNYTRACLSKNQKSYQKELSWHSGTHRHSRTKRSSFKKTEENEPHSVLNELMTLHSSAERSCLGLRRLNTLGSETQLESYQEEVNHLLCKPDGLSSTLRGQREGERCGEERIKAGRG